MLKFNDIDLAEMGVLVIEDFPIPVSILREESQVIPGRDGELTYSDGSYEGCEITGKIAIIPNENYSLDDIILALQGWGKLMIPGVPDRYFIAKVNNIVPLSQFVRNQVYEIPITFKCQPFGYLLSGLEESTLNSGTYNSQGNVKAKPLIKINTSAESYTITINSRKFTVYNTTINTIIDSELGEAIDTATGTLLNTSGEFPYFDIGQNNVTVSMTSKIQFNWRCL
jgi:phage-related protein